MGRIFSSNSSTNASTSQPGQIDSPPPHSTTDTSRNLESPAEKIALLRTLLDRVNQIIRNIDYQTASTANASSDELREDAVNFKNVLKRDLRRLLDGRDDVSYSDSSEYASGMRLILDNHQPPSRRGYHPTSTPFDFSQSSQHHSSSDSA